MSPLGGFTYQYYRKLNSDHAYIVLHGAGVNGIESPFISKILSRLAQLDGSVLGINFPFCSRGEDSSSGEELIEEQAALQQAVDFLKNEGYKNITIIGKSLGFITTSFWLEKYSGSIEIDLIALGYVVGDVKTENLVDYSVFVIQGENDRFGDGAVVNRELAKHNIEASIIEIKGADHSYRNALKEPALQDKAISSLIEYCQG